MNENSVSAYSNCGKLYFIHCCENEPNFDIFSQDLQIFRYTNDVYANVYDEYDQEENDKNQCVLKVQPLNENNDKFLVKHYKGEKVAGDNIFIVYFSPKIGRIIHETLLQRFISAKKFVKVINIHDRKVLKLIHFYTITSSL